MGRTKNSTAPGESATEPAKSAIVPEDNRELDVPRTPVRRMGLLFDLFEENAMMKHDVLLGLAGRNLNDANNVAYAVTGLAGLARANRMECSDYYQILNAREEDQVLCAILLMADMLHGQLSEAAETINDDLKSPEGGA